MSERRALAEILIRLSALPRSLIYRQNTGQGWVGKKVNRRPGETIIVEHGMVILRDARPIKFGCEGAGDIVGVIDDMPLQCEVKDDEGRQRTTQKAFQPQWEKCGGVYILARSANEAEDLVNQALLNRMIG